ncbi:hypothetical protein RSAG8_07364, partial [Rhizoctonia solani AG-8 WAC10335]
MDGTNRPSNGIRELAVGLEGVLFGPGGYQWFLKDNARAFAVNTVRGQHNWPIAPCISEEPPASVTSQHQTVEKSEIPAKTPSNPKAMTTKTERKHLKSRVTSSELAQTSSTESYTPILSLTEEETDKIEPFKAVTQPNPTDEVDDDEVDELESSTDGTHEEPTRRPTRSTPHAHKPMLDKSSPMFPLALVPRQTPCFSATSDNSMSQCPAGNRMYVDLAGLPSIPNRSGTSVDPRKSI